MGNDERRFAACLDRGPFRGKGGKPDCRASLAMTDSWAGLTEAPSGGKGRTPDCRASLAMTE
jgi:hypothetical protein